MLNKKEKLRYSKFIRLADMGEEAQRKLKKAKVLVIGAGGLGSAVLPVLASSGVGTIGIVEHDHVEISNLQRQIIYNTEDIGKKKIDATAEYLKKLNPEITLTLYDKPFEERNAKSLVKKYDVVMDCTDNFQTRFLINDICQKEEKTLVYASVSDYEGQVTVFNYKKGKNLRDLFPNIPKTTEDKGIIPTLPQITGSIQANEAIKVLTGRGDVLDAKLLIINIMTNNYQVIEF
jgi:adenylyltransferase/sulfurtransferase